jgi:hypothetical protein
MRKIILILSLITLNLFAYYGVVQFKNEYGFIMSYGWLQQIKDDRYDIYIASDENMGVGNKKIYVKFNNHSPKKVKISIITKNNEVKPYKTNRIKEEDEWYANVVIPFSCEGKCKIRVDMDNETLTDVSLYVQGWKSMRK